MNTKKKAKPFDKLTAILKGKTDKEILDEVAKYPKPTKKTRRCGARKETPGFTPHICGRERGHKGRCICEIGECKYRWTRRTRK